MARLHPATRWIWLAAGLARVGAVALVVAVGDLVLRATDRTPPGPPLLAAAAIVAVGAVVAVVWTRAAWHRWTYRTGPTGLELRHGVVFRVRSVIPYFRVQHVDVTEGPLERALGLARLVVHTAAATTDAEIPGLGLADAEQLREYVLDRAGAEEGV